MKFKKGSKVKIIHRYNYYINNDGIPEHLIIHGNIIPHSEKHNATIVDIYNQYYIVNFINEINQTMQLGYREEDLELISDGYECIPFPTNESYFTARVVKDIIRSNIGIRGKLPDIIPAGSITWLDSKYKQNILNKESRVCPENNRYGANIPSDYFEFIEEFNAANPKFEVGKWYTFNNEDYKGTSYAKFLKLSNCSEYWYFSEYIGNAKHAIYNGNWYTRKCTNKLTDLSEIQQYLPDGHPDKFIKPIGKDEFKEGDYIVVVSGREYSEYVVNNYCYKQYYNNCYLIAETDNKGGKRTPAAGVQFNNNGDKWRYATPEEIAEYDRLGKPYDITTLNKEPIPVEESLVGRYLKALIDRPRGVPVDKGDYVLINEPGYVKIKNTDSIWCCSFIEKYGFELMPEGFVPPIKTEDLIEEAKRRYPVGTKFHPSHVSKDHRFCVITNDCVFIEDSHGIYSKVTTESDYIYEKWVTNDEHPEYGNCTYNRYVYYKETKKWAEIVQEEKPEKWGPKVDDWVICIGDTNISKQGKSAGWEKGLIFRVTKFYNNIVWGGKNGNGVWFEEGHIRKAEPHEIPLKTNNIVKKLQHEIEEERMVAKDYTAEEALAELKRRGFKPGVQYTYMYKDGTYDEDEICTAIEKPSIRGGGNYIECGKGYLWHKNNPSVLHRGPMVNVEKLYFSTANKEIEIPESLHHLFLPKVKDYLKPETLLPKTTLNY